jgi:hypothetical protein
VCTITSITRVSPVAQALLQPRHAPRLLITQSHGLYINLVVRRIYINLILRRDYSSPGRTGSTLTSPCVASTCRLAAVALPRLRSATGCTGYPCRTSGFLGTSRGSLRGSSSTTSPASHVRVLWHIAQLVTRLVVTHFTYNVRSGASAHRAAHRAAPYRLLRLCRASGCLDTLRGSSSTTSPTPRIRVPRRVMGLVTWLIVDYFVYVV